MNRKKNEQGQIDKEIKDLEEALNRKLTELERAFFESGFTGGISFGLKIANKIISHSGK